MLRFVYRHSTLTFLLVVGLDTVLTASALAQPPTLPSVVLRDDAAGDPEFARFKARILAAAETGDTKTLMASMTSDVSSQYDPSTPERVLALYRVTPGRPWLALRDALRLGTAKSGREFVAPSTDALGLDADRAIIIAKDVRLRAAPSDRAPVLRLLPMLEIVTLDRNELYDANLTERSEHPTGPEAWARVTAANGQTGYVFGRLLRSSENSTFVFRQIDGQWKLAALAAGPG